MGGWLVIQWPIYCDIAKVDQKPLRPSPSHRGLDSMCARGFDRTDAGMIPLYLYFGGCEIGPGGILMGGGS